MSTLTSSPSPGISPRSSFHVQRSSYTAPSTTKPSPRSTWTTSLSPGPRAFNAPLFSASASPSISIRLPKEYPADTVPIYKHPQYVDAGTQYSPDGYPPTAGAKFATTKTEEQPPGFPPNAASKKRKSPGSPEPMNTSTASSVQSSAGQPPPEPEPRRDPSAPQSGVVAGPSSQPHPQRDETRATQDQSSAPKRSRPEPGTTKIMPALYQNSNPKELGHLISNMLMELIRLNDPIPLRDGRLTRFHSRAPPGISVSDYLQRLIHHATLSPPILLSMVWYIDRLCQLYPIFTINSLTVHRFLITAACVAAKGLSDAFWTNPTYAKIGGIPVSELATLELEFLEKVQWKIVPKPEVLEDYYRSMVERTEGYELEGRVEESSGSTSLGGSEDGEGDGEVVRNEDEEMVDEPS